MNYFDYLTSCPVCQHAETVEYLRLPYRYSEVEEYLFRYYGRTNLESNRYAEMVEGEDFVLSKCARCGALFQSNRPNTDALSTVYNSWIASTSSGRDAAAKMTLRDTLHNASEAIKLISLAMESTSVSEFPEVRALDYGMGNGFFALALKSYLVQVWGSEFSSDRLEYGYETGINTLVHTDELPKEHFHLINTEQVMEHVADPYEVLQKLSGSLVKGGILKVSVPFSSSIESGDLTVDWRASRYARRSPMPLAPLEHLQYYSRQCRQVIAKQHGLELVALSPWSHLRFGNYWSASAALRNVGRAFFLNRFRNYFLLRKPL